MANQKVNQMGEHLPAGITDLAANETWLEDRAKAGWLPVRINRWGRVLFEKGEPTQTARYRFQILQSDREKEPGQEQMELNQAFGWRYLGTVPHYYHLWCTDDPAAPELDTEPTLQAESYRNMLRRELRSDCVCTLGVNAVIIALMLWELLSDRGWFLLERVRSFMPGCLILFTLLVSCEVVSIWLQYRTLKQDIRRLSAGISLERPAEYRRKKRRIQLVSWGTFALVWVLFLSRNAGAPKPVGVPSEYGTRPPADTVYLDLSALEDVSFDEEDRSYQIRTKINELVPRMWFVRQNAGYPDAGDAVLDTEYYHALTEGLAARLAQELVNEYQWKKQNEQDMIPVEPGMLDGFWWMRAESADGTGEHWQYAVALRGQNVMGLIYRGREDLREHRDLIAQLLESRG